MRDIGWFKSPSLISRIYLLDRFLPKDFQGRFLEVGIGEGGGSLELMEKRGLDGLGIDFSNQAIEKARLRLRGKISRGIQVKKQDVWRLKGKFDLVIAMEVVEHIKEDQELLQHLFNRLNKGGWLFFSVPAHMEKWSQIDELVGHYRRYNRKTLKQKLRKAGFKKIRILSYGFPLLNLSSFFRNYWLKKKDFTSHLREPKETRSMESGSRKLKSPLKFFFNGFFLSPFCLFQGLFFDGELGIGYVVTAEKP